MDRVPGDVTVWPDELALEPARLPLQVISILGVLPFLAGGLAGGRRGTQGGECSEGRHTPTLVSKVPKVCVLFAIRELHLPRGS